MIVIGDVAKIPDEPQDNSNVTSVTFRARVTTWGIYVTVVTRGQWG